ncbi:MAG TPA: hypothetical protein VMF56_16540 [Acidobacteriaceae bacterium]|nr:hypothetical protein [Acidobacteriaceae bacterium]
MTAAAQAGPAAPNRKHRGAICALYLLATIQLVWAYHSRVPPYLHLDRYENGLEVTPCQTRVLMMWLLRWAHHNPFLIHLADLFSRFTPIYRSHITPETFIFAITDAAGIVLAGWVATCIYNAASERRLLTAYVYPLVLVLCAATYVLVSLHPRRFYYDLPSLGFFAAGLYLIYFRKHPLWFAVLFVVATLNRETTLLLLLFFVLAAMTESGNVDWRRGYSPRTLAVVIPLSIFWIVWHIYVNRLFAHNHAAWIPAYKINLVLLAWPPAWPQLFAAGGYTLLPIVLYRKRVNDATLRIWLWTLPAWFGLMLLYAIMVESRLYGELIPYLACMGALIAEQSILARMTIKAQPSKPARIHPKTIMPPSHPETAAR